MTLPHSIPFKQTKPKPLPYDILSTIYAFVGTIDFGWDSALLRDEHEFNYGLLNDRKRAWEDVLEVRKNASRVSKAWSDAGIPFLYRDIYLHRIGQVCALRRTLEGPGGGEEGETISAKTVSRPNATRRGLNMGYYGRFVTTVIIDAYVPHAWESVFDEDVGRIFALCPNIKTVMLNHTFNPAGVKKKQQERMKRMKMGAEYLDFRLSRVPGIISSLLHPNSNLDPVSNLGEQGLLRNLTTLVFGQLYRNEDFWAHSVHYPFLQTLQHLDARLEVSSQLPFGLQFPSIQILALSIPASFDPESITRMQTWSLPNLTRLTLHCGTMELVAGILHVLGENLAYLCLDDSHGMRDLEEPRAIGLNDILPLTPKLEHAVLDQWRIVPLDEPHASLRRIDLASPFSPEHDEAQSYFVNILGRERLPSLQMIGLPHFFADFREDAAMTRLWMDLATSIGGVEVVDPLGRPVAIPVEFALNGAEETLDESPDFVDEDANESDGSSEYWDGASCSGSEVGVREDQREWSEQREQFDREGALQIFHTALTTRDMLNPKLLPESGVPDQAVVSADTCQVR